MKRRSTTAGVSLLETLVALLMIAMIATLLSAGFGTTTRYWFRSSQATLQVEHALARRDLRNFLEHALPQAVPNDVRPVFAGRSSELTFLAILPDGSFWAGDAVEVTLTVTATLRASGTDLDARTPRVWTGRLASEDIAARVSYWGQAKPDEGARWQAEWDPELGLPDLVRIDFAGDGKVPPPLIVRPGKVWAQSEMSLSSLVPPARPSRP
jgi:Tfp pilus assembly protein PilV